jgi:MinD superfamily P-loop ATPase
MEHLSSVHDRLSAVIVTTPQAVALHDAMKSLSFTREVKLPVLGIVENMSGYICPCCGEISNVFSTGGGEEMARREGVPFLGALPVDTELVSLLDAAEIAPKEGSQLPEKRGFGLARRYQETPSGKLFKRVLDTLLDTLLATERRISPN